MTDLYLTKIALDSGCAYIPAGMNDKPLYIFSVNELERFVELYKKRSLDCRRYWLRVCGGWNTSLDKR